MKSPIFLSPFVERRLMQIAAFSRKTCLVVEDDALLATAFEMVIESTGGWRCDLAESEVAALAYLAHGRPDVALIDCDRSSGASLRVATALLCKDVPVAFLSTNAANAFQSPFSRIRIIEKPATRQTLLRAIDALAGEPSGALP